MIRIALTFLAIAQVPSPVTSPVPDVTGEVSPNSSAIFNIYIYQYGSIK